MKENKNNENEILKMSELIFVQNRFYVKNIFPNLKAFYRSKSVKRV